MKPILIAASILLALANAASAQNADKIGVTSVWARATPPGAKTGVVYMTLMNAGTTDDALIGATTPVADQAGLHTVLMDHGVMKMRPVDGIDLKPGRRAVLKPGSLHLMLTGLKQPLVKGHPFPVTLQFAHAPAMTVQVQVAKIGAASMPDHGTGDIGDMPGMKH